MSQIPINKTEFVLCEVMRERIKQDRKWGQQDHDDHYWNTILMEEVGEAAKASFGLDRKNRRDELIQVAAVAVAAVECIDRAGI